MDVNTLKFRDLGYPQILSDIPHAPKQLYWAGTEPQNWIDRPKVAIVGARKFSAYGKAVTERLATDLARAGVVIISGLAYGIDITAHRAVLATNGTTVAVLPTGIDAIYPVAHIHAARQIADKGTLISEYPPGSVSFRSNFIARNRIVSGLCDVLLITEAAVNSGSLHTARFALEQGRTVMAVPGNINSPSSEGCNNLIKSGAIPVTDVKDIFFALKLNPKTVKEQAFTGSEQEKMIYNFIKVGIGAQEELVEAAKMDGPALASVLTMLEISGYVRPAGGGNWVIA
jgi:DNA processing protein